MIAKKKKIHHSFKKGGVMGKSKLREISEKKKCNIEKEKRSGGGGFGGCSKILYFYLL
jgi:hypothetical protein